MTLKNNAVHVDANVLIYIPVLAPEKQLLDLRRVHFQHLVASVRRVRVTQSQAARKTKENHCIILMEEQIKANYNGLLPSILRIN